MVEPPNPSSPRRRARPAGRLCAIVDSGRCLIGTVVPGLMLALCCGESEEGGVTAAAAGGGPGQPGMAPVGTAAGNTASDSAGAGGPPAVSLPGACASLSPDEDGYLVVPAAEANNYAFWSTLTFQPIAVAPDTNLTFDWSGLTQDFLGHPLDTLGDIDMVSIMLWRLTQEELQVKLNADDLDQIDLANLAMLYTENDRTSGQLLDAQLFQNPLSEEEIMPNFNDVAFPPETHTYTLIASTGTTAGEGSRMIQAFKLGRSSSNDTVTITNESTVLDHTVDMQTAVTEIPAGNAQLTIDWGDIPTNALGNEFTPTSIGEVQVLHFSEAVADLEAQFLDLQLIAERNYSAEARIGTSLELDTLTDESGAPFLGIDGQGTWVLGLLCATCRNPAPWYLSVLRPCGA